MSSSRGWTVAAVAGVVIALSALVATLVAGERLPRGPLRVSWDHEACAECRMHVGDPRFAVQFQSADGRVFAFDDAGCWFLFEAREAIPPHALYFRDSRGDRWLAAEATRFVDAAATPMGSGLAAVGNDEPGSLSLAAARARIVTRGLPEHAP